MLRTNQPAKRVYAITYKIPSPLYPKHLQQSPLVRSGLRHPPVCLLKCTAYNSRSRPLSVQTLPPFLPLCICRPKPVKPLITVAHSFDKRRKSSRIVPSCSCARVECRESWKFCTLSAQPFFCVYAQQKNSRKSCLRRNRKGFVVIVK